MSEPGGGAPAGRRSLLGDADRERLIVLLREHYAAGRLDLDDLRHRVGVVLAAAYAELIGSPVLDPADFPAEPVAAERLGRAFLKQARVIPLAESEAALVVAMADPLDDRAVRALEFALDKEVPASGRAAGRHRGGL